MSGSDRLLRTGRLVARPQGEGAIEMDSACAHCSLGCLSRRNPPDLLELSGSSRATASATPGAQVSVSVSRDGLTRVSALAFGPGIAALLLVAFMANRGLNGWLLLGFGAVMLGLAAAVSRMLVRPRVQRLLQVDTRVIVSG